MTLSTSSLPIPRVRITSILTCPNPRCSRTVYSPAVRRGELWMKCNVAEKQRRGSCFTHWLNITLPNGSTGFDLTGIVGQRPALLILSTIIQPPWTVPADVVLRMPLASEPGKPVHVQIPCRARDEHHLRYAPIADVLRALQIAA